MIDVALLGCGGSMPIPGRYMSATLLRYLGKLVLIDCGEGTQVSVRMLGWKLKQIDVICITHLHGDHFYGLPGLLATIGNHGRTDSISIIGPTGISLLLRDLKVLLPHLPYELIVYENIRDYQMENLEIVTLPLEHSSPCFGYSFNIRRAPKFDKRKAEENAVPKELWSTLQKGNTIVLNDKVYTKDLVLGVNRKGLKVSVITDTRPIDSIIDFIKASDLLICEGSYPNEDSIKALNNKHMTFGEAATLAKKGVVSELILTHFNQAILYPESYLDNATSVFTNSVVGYDRLVKTVNFTD